MPMMELTYPTGALTAHAKDTLPGELSTILLAAEKAPNTAFVRSITWAYLHELASEAVLVAGKPTTLPTFRLDVTVPQGALSERRKALLVEQVTEAILAAAGLGPEAGPLVWVLIHEFPDGNFARAGRVYTYSDLATLAAAGGDPEPEPDTGRPEKIRDAS